MIKHLSEGANWKTCEGAVNTISLPLMTAAFHGFLPLLLKVLHPAHARLSYIGLSLYIMFYVHGSAMYIVGVGTVTAVKIEANSKLSVKKNKIKYSDSSRQLLFGTGAPRLTTQLTVYMLP